MSVLVESILLVDIGATNARLSLLANGNLTAISSFEVAKFGRFTDALAIFIKEHCRQTQIHKALLAIAGPVKNELVALTNSSWGIDIPPEFISPDSFGVTQAALRYLTPLIAGEAYPPFKNGLPRYVRLQNVTTAKKLTRNFAV